MIRRSTTILRYPHIPIFGVHPTRCLRASVPPPKSAYFSFVSYVLDRFHFDEDHSRRHRREELFASLGASLNNLVWNTSNRTDNSDALTTVIQTADRATFDDIYTLLASNDIYNVSSKEMNLQSVPNEYVNFVPYKYNNANINEYNMTYDVGTVLVRIALPNNGEEYSAYIGRNQTVFMFAAKAC